jgi:hypothetical protein
MSLIPSLENGGENKVPALVLPSLQGGGAGVWADFRLSALSQIIVTADIRVATPLIGEPV